jgi:hypothetical protein
MEKKKGRIALIVGTLLLITTFILYSYRPAVSGEELVTVQEAAVSAQENGTYHCSVTDVDSEIAYHHESANQEEAEAFCSQFEVGSEYTISFEYDLDLEEYKLIELKEKE